MKVVQINSVSGMGSTGTIAENISRLLNERNKGPHHTGYITTAIK